MALINVSTGFHIGSPVAIDDRLVLSKENMRTIEDGLMPDIYFALCRDDNKIYVYKRTNTIDSKTGRFRISSLTDNDIKQIVGEAEHYHTVTQEEHDNPESIYYGKGVGSVYKISATGLYKYTDDKIDTLNKQVTYTSYLSVEANANRESEFTVVVNNVEVLRSNKDPDTVDTTWYNPENTQYNLTTFGELKGLSQLVNSGTDSFEGKTIVLDGDIDLHGEFFEPIGIPEVTSANGVYKLSLNDWGSKIFKGNFDGNGHTISNLNIIQDNKKPVANNNYGVGFFGIVAPGSTIKNITFENVKIDSPARGFVGTVVGFIPKGDDPSVTTTIENITVKGIINILGNFNVGTIIGRSEANSGILKIKNCHVEGYLSSKIDASYPDTFTAVGGLVGCLYSNRTVITESSVDNLTVLSGKSQAVGGIAGHIENGEISNNALTNVSIINTINNFKNMMLECASTGLLAGTHTQTLTNKITATNNNFINSSVRIPEQYTGEYGSIRTLIHKKSDEPNFGFPAWGKWPLFGTPRNEQAVASYGASIESSDNAYENTFAYMGVRSVQLTGDNL